MDPRENSPLLTRLQRLCWEQRVGCREGMQGGGAGWHQALGPGQFQHVLVAPGGGGGKGGGGRMSNTSNWGEQTVVVWLLSSCRSWCWGKARPLSSGKARSSRWGKSPESSPKAPNPGPFPSPAQGPHTEEEHGPAGSTWCWWDVDTLGDCVINSACAEFGWLRPSRPQRQLCNSDPFRRARPERARGCTSSWETRWEAASALLVPGAGLCLAGQEEVLGCPWEGAEQEGGQGLTCSAAPTPCAPGSPGSARS